MTSPQRKTVVEFFRDQAVLLVEDRPGMRRTMRTMLKTYGIPPENIYEAGDGPDALSLMRQIPKDFFVLLDLNLPTMSGMDILAQMQKNERLARMAVVVVTADNHQGSVAHAIEMGARGYIVKPFTEKTLKEKLSNIINPPDFLETFDRIEGFINRKEYDKAAELADVLLEIKSGSPGAYVLRGEAFEGLGKDDLALASYEAAHRHAPIYLRVLDKLIEFHRRRKDFGEAVRYLEKAGKLSPYNAQRRMDLGRALLETDPSGRKAQQAFDEAVKLDSSLVDQAAEACIDKHPALAEKYYRSALALKKDIATINRLGIALRNQGKWAEAVKEYELALRIAPDDEGLHFNLGRAYAEGGSIREAIRSFQRALDLNPYMKPARLEKDRLTALFREMVTRGEIEEEENPNPKR